ncbi:MAG: PEGA domain-containing protein [Myxococcales bacterium]|nr:PEGA domain-containing protein [Myxococcales bacterium]
MLARLRSSRRRVTTAVVLTAVTTFVPFLVRGQPLPPTGPAPSASASASASGSAAPGSLEDRKEQAKNHYLAGVKLMQSEQWDAALAEFTAALVAYPTSNTRKNAAICLQRLGRFDEAIEMWEARLKEFGASMPGPERELTEKALLDLKPLVGYLVITANVEGASVVVDGRDRGQTPLAGPIAVSAGTRYVRVVREGFAPFEAKPSVAGKSTVKVDAKLEALARVGHLRIMETAGQAVEVQVDGVVVGKTPSETVVAPGTHTVVLRGEGNYGTQPQTVKVEVDQTAVMRLTVVPLPCEAQLEPTPAFAAVALDGVPLGNGAWTGRLTAGKHELSATAEGYLPARKTFEVEANHRANVKITLERDESSSIWAEPVLRHRWSLALGGAFGFGASLGGEIEASCGDGVECSARTRPWLAGGFLRGGYDLTSRVGLELTFGYARAAFGVTRNFEAPGGKRLAAEGGPVAGELVESFSMGGPLLTAGIGFAVVREPRVSIGVAGGVWFARAQLRRDGVVDVDADPKRRPLYEASSEAAVTVVPVVLPELRISFPLDEHFQIGGSLGLFLGFAEIRPRVLQTAKGSPQDLTDGQPANPTSNGKFVGYVPSQRAQPESATAITVLGNATLFVRYAF